MPSFKLPPSRVTLFTYLPGWWVSLLLSLALLLVGYFIYRAAVHIQAQFGELYKSVFDIYEQKIDVSKIVGEVARIAGDPAFERLSRKDQVKVAWRYLQHYRIRCLRCNDRLLPVQARGHVCQNPSQPAHVTEHAAGKA
jgi:hypothetical protein